MSKENKDAYIRIPITLKRGEDAELALAIKQGIERRQGSTITWANLVRRALLALAEAEGIVCK